MRPRPRTVGGVLAMALLGLAACGDDSVIRVAAPPAAPIARPERLHVRAPEATDLASVAHRSVPTLSLDAPAASVRLREAPIDDLVAMLATTTGRLRRDALYELVRLGPPESSLEVLMTLLSDDDAATAAAHALACFGVRATRAIRARVAELRVSDRRGAEDDEDAGDEIGSLEYGFLEILWLDPDLDEREASSAPAPPPPGIDTLRSWLSDESPETRCAGAVAAGKMGADARELVPLVASALAAQDAEDLDVIAKAMRNLGAAHEALLVIRARMAGASTDQLHATMDALAQCGEIARDDVVAFAPRLLRDGGEFGRVAAFDALRATGADPAPYSEAIAASLGEFAYDRSAAARLLAAHPAMARELRDDLVRALPHGEFSGGRSVVTALRAIGGVTPEEALHLLDTVESFRVDRVLAVVGPDTAAPGDEVALRLWRIVLEGERHDVTEGALEALERAAAIDARDLPRLLDAVEQHGLGTCLLAELCRTTTVALPRLLAMLERGDDVAWPLAMLGPRAAPALPRLVLEARDQDTTAANAVGAIGVLGVEPLRRALDGQHAGLRETVLLAVLAGVRETAEDRTETEVDAVCRGYLALLVDAPPERLGSQLAALSVHYDSDVRWAADRVR